MLYLLLVVKGIIIKHSPSEDKLMATIVHATT